MGLMRWLRVPERRRRTLARMLEELGDADAGVRQQAAFELLELARFVEPEDRSRLEAAVRGSAASDPALGVRFVCVLVLDQLGHRDEPGPVLDVLRAGGDDLFAAASVAAWFPTPAMVDALAARLHDDDPAVVEAVAESLAHIGDPRAAPALQSVEASARRRTDRRAASAALRRMRSA